jgi:S-layer homology domain
VEGVELVDPLFDRIGVFDPFSAVAVIEDERAECYNPGIFTCFDADNSLRECSRPQRRGGVCPRVFAQFRKEIVMPRIRRSLLPLLSSAALVALLTVPAADGQQLSVKDQMVKARAEALASGATGNKNQPGPNYGITSGSAVSIHSWEFQAFDPYNAHVFQDGNSYRYFSAAPAVGQNFLAAPVNDIPSGSIIDFVSASNCSNGDGDIFLGLWDGGYGNGFPCTVCNAGANITFLSSLNGCGEDFIGGLNYQYTQTYGHPLYILMLWGANYDGSTKFNAVTVGYHRMVSPAPAVASFGDVPLVDPAFQYVEALVASGVTAGCGGGNYCPDNPVTRRQMAVFISKALGLHWPN